MQKKIFFFTVNSSSAKENKDEKNVIEKRYGENKD